MSIHGDKSQQECDPVLNEFRHGKAPIQIAVEVACRGLVCLFVCFSCKSQVLVARPHHDNWRT